MTARAVLCLAIDSLGRDLLLEKMYEEEFVVGVFSVIVCRL